MPIDSDRDAWDTAFHDGPLANTRSVHRPAVLLLNAMEPTLAMWAMYHEAIYHQHWRLTWR